jgi:hypothetical protein
VRQLQALRGAEVKLLRVVGAEFDDLGQFAGGLDSF